MTIIGYTLGIPDVIMGITFLAAGTSVPDCMASLIVARQGMGQVSAPNAPWQAPVSAGQAMALMTGRHQVLPRRRLWHPVFVIY